MSHKRDKYKVSKRKSGAAPLTDSTSNVAEKLGAALLSAAAVVRPVEENFPKTRDAMLDALTRLEAVQSNSSSE